MSRRFVSLAPIAIALAVLAGGGGCSDPEAPPNVVLVTLDTTRADRLGCYGSTTTSTPAADALASDGVLFEQAFAQAALTPVSHASILTGLLPHHHGVRVLFAASGYELSKSIPTLSTVLKAEGYATAAFLSSFTVSEFYGFEAGFDRFDNGLDHGTESVFTKRPGGWYDIDIADNQRRADATTDAVAAWLETVREPFFLWVHYWDPHDAALIPPESVLAQYTPRIATKEEHMRTLYDIEVDYVDSQIGRLIAELRRHDAYDRSLIAVVADHGQGLGDHDFWYHRILYQEQIRVPLILRLPDGPRGVRVAPVVRTTDIFPTVLAYLGIKPHGRVDGESLLGLIAGRDERPRSAYAESLIKLDLNAAKRVLANRPHDDLLHCIVDGPWKLIYRPTAPELSELYNLSDDPRESDNRLRDEPAHVARLVRVLEGMDVFRDEPFGEGTDQEALERLRSLGYVQ